MKGIEKVFMKLVYALCLVAFVVTALAGCRIHSIIDLQNPEFPLALSPADLSVELFDKYAVGNVIVEPQIRHGSVQDRYKLAVLFASKTEAITPRIQAVSVSVNGVPVTYEGLIGEQCSKWDPYPDGVFFVCSITGPDVNPPSIDMTKACVDVYLTVAVTDESGKCVEKQIYARFVPKKRSYLE